jgi:N-methylhydantoinase A
LACSLGIPAVIVPQNPGAFSAMGILLSDVIRDVSQSVLLPVPTGAKSQLPTFLAMLGQRFEFLHRKTNSELKHEGFDADRARASRRVDVRYRGQSYELSVAFTPGFREEFHREHIKAYGYAYPERPVEIVNLRLRLVIPTAKSGGRARKLGPAQQSQEALLMTKPVWFESKLQPTRIYDRARLAPGAELAGPAVIVEYSATTVVPPDFTCNVDGQSNLILQAR